MPAGVPVEMMSPGSSVMTDEMNSTSSSIGKISSLRATSPGGASPLTQPSTAEPSGRVVEPGGDARADRREGVEPLGARVLDVLLLQLARGDVVHAREAEDVVDARLPRHAPRAPCR